MKTSLIMKYQHCKLEKERRENPARDEILHPQIYIQNHHKLPYTASTWVWGINDSVIVHSLAFIGP